MIDSLFDLIAAAFIASLPVLLAIIRSRRNRSGRRRRRDSEDDTLRAKDKAASEARKSKKSPGRAAAFFRRLRGGTATEPQEPPEAMDRPQPRRPAPPKEEGTMLEGLESEKERGSTGGKERLIQRVDRYPPLQRAIVLKELLGPPKGFE